ncbi:MAG TPA: hypothetical protein VGA68_01035 [Woeseiaceae bacterium]
MTAGFSGICALALASLVAPAAVAQDSKVESVERLYKQESTGLRHYNSGNYEKAFDNLSTTAARGFKESQYILAFMFLKGQHVDASLVLGMGWLGVAIESEEPEWIELYDSIYERVSPEQQQLIEAKVAQYVAQFGRETQNVTCSRRQSAGTRRIESRCIKDTERLYPIFPVELTVE